MTTNRDPRDAATIFNREWRINHLYKIQTKSVKDITFKRNAAQKIMAATRKLKTLILKSRQHGMTTQEVIEALDDVLFRMNFTAAIIAHRQDKVQEIFRKAKFAFDRLPDKIQLYDGSIWVKPIPKYDNRNELFFPAHGSRFFVATDTVSNTVHRLHISEAAKIKDAFRTIPQSLASVPANGTVTMETTAEGAGGYFFELWQSAVEGENDYTPVFLGWTLDPENATEPPPDFTLTTEEAAYQEHWSLTLPQMCWRRSKQQEQKDLFPQEFPISAEEAFLTSGRPVFPQEKITDWTLRDSLPWGEIYPLLVTKTTPAAMSALEGRLKVFILPQKGHRYVLGADISEGISADGGENSGPEGGSDFTAIEIFDVRTMQQVAEWRSRFPYHEIDWIITSLGRFYNFAFLGVERNNHGLTVVSNLAKSDYPDQLIYTEQVLDEKTQKKRKRWGWNTNSVTRPLMLDDLNQLIWEDGIKVFSRILAKECQRFIIADDGKMKAQDGYHDDTVIATAIACQMRKYAIALPQKAYRKEDFGF